jgi:hypothetical protein
MKKLIMIIIVGLTSCTIAKKAIVEKNISTTVLPIHSTTDSLFLIVQSSNLSEDMSSLSSNNDEVAIFIYSFTDSIIHNPPVFSANFVLTKNQMADTFNITSLKNNFSQTMILFLLELDTERSIQEMAPLLPTHCKKIIQAYTDRNYLEIENYLGDDDVLGIQIIKEFNHTSSFEFNDIYKMDRFSYKISIE